MPLDKTSGRLLIFIVAYNAESTLKNVLRRIPPSIYQYDYRILIIDDSSSDETVKSALAYKQSNPRIQDRVVIQSGKSGLRWQSEIGLSIRNSARF